VLSSYAEPRQISRRFGSTAGMSAYATGTVKEGGQWMCHVMVERMGFH
jgi:hypothetical protein